MRQISWLTHRYDRQDSLPNLFPLPTPTLRPLLHLLEKKKIIWICVALAGLGIIIYQHNWFWFDQ